MVVVNSYQNGIVNTQENGSFATFAMELEFR